MNKVVGVRKINEERITSLPAMRRNVEKSLVDYTLAIL